MARLRGISPFVTCLLTAHDLQDIIEGELDVSKMTRKWLGFVKTPDPATWQSLRNLVQDPERLRPCPGRPPGKATE